MTKQDVRFALPAHAINRCLAQVKYGGNCEAAKAIGTALAERAKEAGITQVKFDRGSYKFHGRVAELANAAREAGLKF